MKRVVLKVQDTGDVFTHRWPPGTLQGRAAPGVPEQSPVLGRDRGADAQHASAAEPWLLRSPPSALCQRCLPRRTKLRMGERVKIKSVEVLNTKISLAKVNMGKILQHGHHI